MATVDVFNLKREKVGSLDLADEVFGAEVKEQLFYEVVKAQLASRAQGTAAAKERSRGQRLDEEALQAEGHRARASRLDPRADLRRRRSGAPAAPARLELPSAAPGAPRRAHAARSRSSRKEGRLIVVDRFELAEIKTKGSLERARRRSRPRRRRSSSTPRTTRTSSSRSATARATSSCRPKASTSTTSSATTRSSSRRTPRRRSKRAASKARRGMTMTPEHIIRRPIILTEKAQPPRASSNQVVFEVARDANKIQIKDAVQTLFKVKVDERQHAASCAARIAAWAAATPRLQNWKKAVVTLKEGDDDRLLRGDGVRASHGNQELTSRRRRRAATTRSPTSRRSPRARSPRRRSDRAPDSHRRPQQPRPHHLALPRRWSQAALPHHRLASATRSACPRTVASIEYDPNRTARIALLHYADGEKRYILAPDGLKVGDKIVSSRNADIKPGNALPLRYIPLGTMIHNIELQEGQGRRSSFAPPASRRAAHGEGRRLRAGALAVAARSAWSTSTATRPSARCRTSTTRTSRSARPVARAGSAGVRTTAASR